MNPRIHQEEVDIYQYPNVNAVNQAKAGDEITLGDLHGNAMKLMFSLIYHGFVTNINEDDYAELVRIYRTSATDLTEKDLTDFQKIVDTAKYHSGALLRLIGDTMCDRGQHDYCTLKILKKLRENGVTVEILFSNHDAEFIRAYETQKNVAPVFFSELFSDSIENASSMESLQMMIDRGLVKIEDIYQLIDEAYKPFLKAYSYKLNEDKSAITIFTHAISGLTTLENAAKHKFIQVAYADHTALELAHTMDKVNKKFREHVEQNTVCTLYNPLDMKRGYYQERNRANLSSEPSAAFAALAWQRNKVAHQFKNPSQYCDYKLYFVHGHDPQEEERAGKAKNPDGHIFNIDNDNLLGKFEHLNAGIYTVLYSGGMALGATLEQSHEKEEERRDSSNDKPDAAPTIDTYEGEESEETNAPPPKVYSAENAPTLFSPPSSSVKCLPRTETDSDPLASPSKEELERLKRAKAREEASRVAREERYRQDELELRRRNRGVVANVISGFVKSVSRHSGQ